MFLKKHVGLYHVRLNTKFQLLASYSYSFSELECNQLFATCFVVLSCFHFEVVGKNFYVELKCVFKLT